MRRSGILRSGRRRAAHLLLRALKIGGGVIDALRDGLHIGLAKAARGDGGRADADAAGDEGALRVVRDRVFVGRDVVLVEAALQLLAGDVQRAQDRRASGDYPCRRRRGSKPRASRASASALAFFTVWAA